MKTSSRKRGNGLSTLVLFAVGLLIALRAFPKNLTSSGQPATVITEVLKENGYSDRVAKNWVAVSKHETANFTSNLLRTANNLFGMKQPLKRMTVSKGPTKNGFASFASLTDSVKDLVLYMDEWNYPKDFASVDDQVRFMKSKGYFQEPLLDYMTSVKARL